MLELKIYFCASTKQLISSSQNKIAFIKCITEIIYFCSLLCIINVFLDHLAKTVIILKWFGLLIRLLTHFKVDTLSC
jgi:hypothetical protein